MCGGADCSGVAQSLVYDDQVRMHGWIACPSHGGGPHPGVEAYEVSGWNVNSTRIDLLARRSVRFGELSVHQRVNGSKFHISIHLGSFTSQVWARIAQLDHSILDQTTKQQPKFDQCCRFFPGSNWNLPRKTDSRLEARSNVFVSASLITRSSSLPVRIRNLSPRGVLLDGNSLPPIGTEIQLVRGGLSASGHVAWQDGDHVGIHFDEQIDVDQWVRRVEHPGQQRVDNIVAALKRDESAPEGKDATLPSLIAISLELDQICARLAGSSELTIELGEELLKLDALAQTLRQAATRGRR